MAHIEDTKSKTIHGLVKANVEEGSNLMTDEDRCFVGMDGHFNVESVCYSAGERLFYRIGSAFLIQLRH